MKTYKYKIQNHKRNRHLQADTRIISQVHNHFIALCRRHYRIYGHCEGYKRANYNHLSKHLTKLKKLSRYAHWRIPHSWALQECLKRIEFGYINFFEGRAKRPPKFKSWRNYRSMIFAGKQVKIERVAKDTGCRVAKIRLAGRWYRFWYSREIQGNIKRTTAKRDALGDWYITVLTDAEGLEPEPKTGDAAGFDYGNKTFLTCSDGTKYESPEFYKQSRKAIKQANRELSRNLTSPSVNFFRKFDGKRKNVASVWKPSDVGKRRPLSATSVDKSIFSLICLFAIGSAIVVKSIMTAM